MELGIVAIVIVCVLLILFGVSLINVANVPTHPSSIEEATQLVRQTVRDVNYDRKINCIDYAVVFYEVWTDSTIIRVWDNQELNHLLNMVDGQYREPQVRSGDPHILWSTFDTAHRNAL
jgi:hypothetical protein